MKAYFALLMPFAALLANPASADATVAKCTAPPTSMRAARIHAAGGPEALRLEQIPVPQPREGEVLVRIEYASVNPVDWKLQEWGRLQFPATPGADLAGQVVAIGAGVSDFACGDLVAGIADTDGSGGSYAEYASVPVKNLVHKPARYSMAEAAAYPTVAVAVWRYMVLGGGLKKGERVLIHGGAGGVGSVAVQVAKAQGAHVITTASARNHEYLRSIGADEVIDYRTTRFEDVVRDVDLVVDTIGKDTLLRSEKVLRDGGRLVSMVARISKEICESGRISCPAIPDFEVRGNLQAIAPLIDAGKIQINIDRTFTLDSIIEAQQYNKAGATRGKVVVRVGAVD